MAVAVKTLHGISYQTMYQRIDEGAKQIDRSGKDGFVWINLKNRIDKSALVDRTAVHETDDAAPPIADIVEPTERLVNLKTL